MGEFNIEGIHYITGKPVSIQVINDLIGEIREVSDYRGDQTFYVAPGFIDNQVNGYSNVDFSGDNLTVESVITATRAILNDGVTSFMPTLVTNSHENLLKNFAILAEACGTDELVSSAVPGFHLEGPYISPLEGFRGCHQLEYIRKPSWEEFSRYQQAAGGRIIQVTIAPETEGAIDFIKRCKTEGIIVAIGHSNASADDVNMAAASGARLSTHLGNGCANMIHRHNNPLWPQLADERLTASIICDGNHLLPDEVKVFHRVKGTSGIILTSDVIYLAGMKPGKYRFAGMDVLLKENGMLLNVSQNCLAGASFPLKYGVKNVMSFAGVSLADAVKMASENVAEMYGLNNRGKLETGRRADILLLRKNVTELEVVDVWKGGVKVESAKTIN